MPRTAGIECGLWPTPRAMEIVESPEAFAARNGDRTTASLPNLSSAAKYGLLPTPTAAERDRRPEELAERRKKYGGEMRGVYLSHLSAAGMLPTPAETNQDRTECVRPNGEISRLSTQYVGDMMGYPVGWTESPFRNGGESH